MKRITAVVAALAVLAWGCASGDDDGDTSVDTTVDTDAPTDGLDGTDVPADGTDTGTGDTGTEAELPENCEGPDTLTLEFLDPDEAPIEGVAVALSCLGETFEADSGTDGRVSFSNLDLDLIPVDFTYVHDNLARTYVGLGGPRTVPDPFRIHIGAVDDDPPSVTIEGDIDRTVPGSWVLVSAIGGFVDMTTEDRYQVDSLEGTGLDMYALEWTTDGTVATPVAAVALTYDAPAGGGEGPAVTPVTGGHATATLPVVFDVDTESPMLDSAWLPEDDPTNNRIISGARLVGEDADENFAFFGLTMDWSGGFSSPDMHVAYVPEALTDLTEVSPDLWIVDHERNLFAVFQLPEDDPTAWTTFTVHDVPQTPGLDVETPVRLDTPIEVEHPDWTPTYTTYHVRLQSSSGALGQASYQWVVITHPETTGFTLGGLPWPSSEDLEDVLPGIVTLRFGCTIRAYDADPFADYVLWTEDDWALDHYLATMADSRFIFEL